MDLEKVKAILEEKYLTLTTDVIAELMEICPDEVIEDEDSPFDTAWEAFADQAQNEDGVYDEAYEELVDELCLDRLEQLSDTELKLLWLGAGSCTDWPDEDPAAFPSEEQMQNDVLEEMYSWIEQKAADIDLEVDEEEDEDFDDEEEDGNDEDEIDDAADGTYEEEDEAVEPEKVPDSPTKQLGL